MCVTVADEQLKQSPSNHEGARSSRILQFRDQGEQFLKAHTFADVSHILCVAEVALVFERYRQVKGLASIDDVLPMHK